MLDPNGSPTFIDLPTVPDPRGPLTFAERDTPLPFQPRRVYWIHGIPEGAERGGHAHRRTHEVIVCLAGSFRVTLQNPRHESMTLALDSPSRGIYVPPMWWRQIDHYAGGAVCLVIASLDFDEEDYLRDPDAFFESR